jgi:hypothetical protein
MIALTKNLSTTLAALVVWGFLMAFLFNVLMRITTDKKDDFLLFTSFVIFLSYFISDHLFTLSDPKDVYLTWFIYDVITLGVILSYTLFYKCKRSIGVIYVYIGLAVNSCLFLAMYVDIVVMSNRESWWLWTVYSAGVVLFDFMMIFALILNKDYLGIIRFSKLITSPIRKKALS